MYVYKKNYIKLIIIEPDNINGNQILINEIDSNTIEKLRTDLLRQAEVSNKLETLCLQYRQVYIFKILIKIFYNSQIKIN